MDSLIDWLTQAVKRAAVWGFLLFWVAGLLGVLLGVGSTIFSPDPNSYGIGEVVGGIIFGTAIVAAMGLVTGATGGVFFTLLRSVLYRRSELHEMSPWAMGTLGAFAMLPYPFWIVSESLSGASSTMEVVWTLSLTAGLMGVGAALGVGAVYRARAADNDSNATLSDSATDGARQ